MSSEKQELARRLSLAIGRVNRQIRPTGEGLSVGLVSALSTVVAHDGIRASDLARIEKVAPPSMTRVVGDLEARGLVAREADPADGRASLIRITPLGIKAIEVARDSRADQLLALVEAAEDVDVAQLRDAVHLFEGLLRIADSV